MAVAKATATKKPAAEVPAAKWDETVDLLVLGSGAGGLSAAVGGAARGLKSLVLESTEFLGGTTSYSAGTTWTPGNKFYADPDADIAQATKYLDLLVGTKADKKLRTSYLNNAPEAIAFLEKQGLGFRHSATVVDYHPEVEGWGIGRALEPEPFDGRRLGHVNFRHVRWPVPEFALFGGTLMVRRAEVNQLLKIYQWSPAAAWLALKLGVRWFFDMLRYPRGTRLTMGNALVAALYDALLRLGGEVRLSAQTRALITDKGRVIGAEVEIGGRIVRIQARKGVVLAGGGFSASATWRREQLPEPTPQFTRAVVGAQGTTLGLGLDAGAALGNDHGDNAFWFPSSIGRRRDGSQVVFPHIWDRAKPGIIAVNGKGKRFVDESVSYHRFTRAMYAQPANDRAVPAYLIMDSHTLRAYGAGMIRPHSSGRGIRQFVRDGYILQASSIADLAKLIGATTAQLEKSVAQANEFAKTGIDTEFGKGTSPFGLQYGDPAHQPNPNLGPIEHGPFYALPLVPTPLGTARGLKTDADARVLSKTGKPIPGLYACGNDADSAMASEYPGAGCQVGAGITFGYLAAKDAAAN